jgi:hypothetical protein
VRSQEFEEYYEMKLGRKPTIVRKVADGSGREDVKMPPLPSGRSASSGRSSKHPMKKYVLLP